MAYSSVGGLANWGGDISVNGEDGKYSCLNFLQPHVENVDKRSGNDGNRKLSLKKLTLRGCPLRPRRAEGEKASSDQHPRDP